MSGLHQVVACQSCDGRGADQTREGEDECPANAILEDGVALDVVVHLGTKAREEEPRVDVRCKRVHAEGREKNHSGDGSDES